jgi:hypothetical protein
VNPRPRYAERDRLSSDRDSPATISPALVSLAVVVAGSAPRVFASRWPESTGSFLRHPTRVT